MIVSELIKELNKHPQDMIVLGRGYESGFNDIEGIRITTLVKCDNSWYDGNYQYPDVPSGTPIEDQKEYLTIG